MSSKWGIAGSKGSKEGGIEEAAKGGKKNINEKQIKKQGRRSFFIIFTQKRIGGRLCNCYISKARRCSEERERCGDNGGEGEEDKP